MENMEKKYMYLHVNGIVFQPILCYTLRSNFSLIIIPFYLLVRVALDLRRHLE